MNCCTPLSAERVEIKIVLVEIVFFLVEIVIAVELCLFHAGKVISRRLNLRRDMC